MIELFLSAFGVTIRSISGHVPENFLLVLSGSQHRSFPTLYSWCA